MPSIILIHPTVWPQYTNVTDRTGQVTDRTRNSSGDEIAKVNFLRRHRICRGQRLRPFNRLPNLC